MQDRQVTGGTTDEYTNDDSQIKTNNLEYSND